MAHENLDGPEICACLEHMAGKAVSKSMGGDMLGDAGPLGRFLQSFPDDLRRYRLVGAPAVSGAGEQIGLRSQPAPVGTQGFQQLLAQGNLAVNATLPTLDANDHTLTIDVADLQ